MPIQRILKQVQLPVRKKGKQKPEENFLTRIFNNYRNYRKYVKGELL